MVTTELQGLVSGGGYVEILRASLSDALRMTIFLCLSWVREREDGGVCALRAGHCEGGKISAVTGACGVFFNCCSATCTLVQSLGLRLVAFGALGSE